MADMRVLMPKTGVYVPLATMVRVYAEDHIVQGVVTGIEKPIDGQDGVVFVLEHAIVITPVVCPQCRGSFAASEITEHMLMWCDGG
jgi:hypothetical protein